MGWWKSGGGEDIIGDGPADELLTAVKEIAAQARAGQRSRPTLPELVSIAAAAVARRPEALIENPQSVPKRPLARVLMRDGSQIDGDPAAPAVDVLWSSFERSAAEYLSTELQRRPTLSELLAALAFVLRAEGTRYMKGVPEEIDIDRIVLEERQG
jgi:hypothetical protein